MAVGIRMSEEMKGQVGGNEITVRPVIVIPNLDSFLNSPDHEAILEDGFFGTTVIFGKDVWCLERPGVVRLFNTDSEGVKHLEYEMKFGKHTLKGHKNIQDDQGADMLSDITTLYTELSYDNTVDTGVLYFDKKDFPQLLTTAIEVTGAKGLIENTKAHYKVLRFFIGEMAKEYILKKIDSIF